ncbi:MAG: hypothetical protein ACRDNP_01510 [Gaiellaceae bacterium]
MIRVRFLLVAAAALAQVVVAPLAGARVQAGKAQSVTVTMTEFKFAFSTTKVHAGKVTFRLVNKGKLAHDLKIAGKKSALIQPGKKGALRVALKWPTRLSPSAGKATRGGRGGVQPGGLWARTVGCVRSARASRRAVRSWSATSGLLK